MIDQTFEETIFNVASEDLSGVLDKFSDDKAFGMYPVTYHILVALPPKIKKKGSIYIPDDTSELNQLKSALARVIAIGPTVGETPALSSLTKLKVGDYIFYNSYAGGSHYKIGELYVKAIADDMVKSVVSQERALAEITR